MRERPILFSAPMVRALLDGRKTQTRRIVKPQPEVSEKGNLMGDWLRRPLDGLLLPKLQDIAMHCQYGVPGDRLWVRETFSTDFRNHYPFDDVWYAADDDRSNEIEVRDGVKGIYSPEHREHVPFRWRPSIHMPRAASRITLEITGVRVERLQDINDSDALAEGATYHRAANELSHGGWSHDGWYVHESARESFVTLWNSLNAVRGFGWDANPWVWVVEFTRIDA